MAADDLPRSMMYISPHTYKVSFSGISLEFHEHLILLMWQDIYEEREERVSYDVREVSSL